MKAGEGAARLAGESVRYLLAGGLNTLASYALYLALLQAMDYRAAYVLAFVAGITLSFALLRHAVFARPGRPFSLLWVAASHLLQLGLGLAVVQAWVAALHGPQWAAPLAAALAVAPFMFVLQRWIFTPHVRH